MRQRPQKTAQPRRPGGSRAAASAAAASPALPFPVATLLFALAVFIAPLLAGIPTDQSWTPIVCGLAVVACAAVLFAGRCPFAKSRIEQMGRHGANGLAALSALSFLWRWLAVDRGSAEYLDAMLRTLVYWLAMAGLVYAGVAIGRDRRSAYAGVAAIVAAAAVASGIALQDYLIQRFRNHIPEWREFGTSTPDYFAGYLILVIPMTLALFLGARGGPGKRMGWLYFLALLLELGAVVSTGSRFSFASLGTALLVFAVGLVVICRNGLSVDGPFRSRLMLLGVIALGALAFAGPLLHRLSASTLAAENNSLEFRFYTWRGALRMAAHYPVFGAGPGMFLYDYTKYAIVGFTRIAHSGYLQALDELGPIAVIAIAFILAAAVVQGLRKLSFSDEAEQEPENSFLSHVAAEPGKERLLLLGMSAGLIAGMIQNNFDSDWNITLCGVTLFALAGLTIGMASPSSTAQGVAESTGSKSRSPIRYSAMIVAGLAAIQCLFWSAAGFAADGMNFSRAAQLAPLSSDYISDLAWKIEARDGNIAGAERDLSRAIQLAPSTIPYYRRATIYDRTGQPQIALKDIADGLTHDPNSLALLLLGAQVRDKTGDPGGALEYYRKMAYLQESPYGKVPALGDITEYRYAYADEALGVDALKTGDPTNAITYLTRSADVLQKYADEGGSTNPDRIAAGGSPDLDKTLLDLYRVVMTALVQADNAVGRPADAAKAQATAASYVPKFIHSPASPV